MPQNPNERVNSPEEATERTADAITSSSSPEATVRAIRALDRSARAGDRERARELAVALARRVEPTIAALADGLAQDDDLRRQLVLALTEELLGAVFNPRAGVWQSDFSLALERLCARHIDAAGATVSAADA